MLGNGGISSNLLIWKFNLVSAKLKKSAIWYELNNDFYETVNNNCKIITNMMQKEAVLLGHHIKNPMSVIFYQHRDFIFVSSLHAINTPSRNTQLPCGQHQRME